MEEIENRNIYCTTCKETTTHSPNKSGEFCCDKCGTHNATSDVILTVKIGIETEIYWEREAYKTEEDWKTFVERMKDLAYAKDVVMNCLDVAVENITNIEPQDVKVLSVVEETKKAQGVAS